MTGRDEHLVTRLDPQHRESPADLARADDADLERVRIGGFLFRPCRGDSQDGDADGGERDMRSFRHDVPLGKDDRAVSRPTQTGNDGLRRRGVSIDARAWHRAQPMKQRSPLLIGIAASVLIVVAAAATAHANPVGNLILRGAAVYTLDTARTWATAVVIQNGRIVYVGDDAGSDAYVAAGARVLALEGRMVLPAFHDSHIHPMTGGMRLLRCRLNNFKSAREVYGAVSVCASANSRSEWLIGTGWSPRVFAHDGPSRAKLDALVP